MERNEGEEGEREAVRKRMERKGEKGSEEDDYFNKFPPTMPSNIFMVYLKNTEQNITTLGRGVHYYVLRKCCYLSCRFVKK
jgi:hypothetical protein